MNREIRGYLLSEALSTGLFNLTLNGMIAALIHHMRETVPTDARTLASDIVVTCFLIFALTSAVCNGSIKRAKRAGIIGCKNRALCFLVKIYRIPFLFSFSAGAVISAALAALTVSVFSVFGIGYLSFGAYIVFKCAFTALYSGSVSVLCLYIGMQKPG